jgi:hypothetical protein
MDFAHPTHGSAGVPSGELVPNTTATTLVPSPAPTPSPAGVRPVVNIKRGGHAQIIYSQPVDPSVCRPRIIRKKSPWLFHRPWMHQPPQTAQRKRQLRAQATQPAARRSGRFRPLAALAPRPLGPMAIVRISTLYERLLRQFRRYRRPRVHESVGHRPAAAPSDGENRRLDPPERRTPPVHWTIQTAASRTGAPWRTDGQESDGKNRQHKRGGQPTPEWKSGPSRSQTLRWPRPADQRLAENGRMGRSFKTCRAQPARRNKFRRPGRAG